MSKKHVNDNPVHYGFFRNNKGEIKYGNLITKEISNPYINLIKFCNKNNKQ